MRLGIPWLLLLLATVGARPVAGQAYSCAADTTTDATNLRDYVVRLTGGDPSLDQTRRVYELPLTSASQVKTETLPKICTAAARAYHLAVRGPSAPAISRKVVVVKVGTSRYVVLDPAERQGEFEVTVIFDARFHALVSFNS
jgi:hypothetical protein